MADKIGRLLMWLVATALVFAAGVVVGYITVSSATGWAP